MSVGETIELSGRALGVGAHVLKVEPVADVEDGVEADALGDAVDAVASWAPDGVLDTLTSGNWVSRGSLVERLARGTEDLCDGGLVIEDDVGEVAVYAVVDIDHVALAVESGILNSSSSDDVAGNGEGRGDVVTTRLGDDVDSATGREELVEGFTEDRSHGLKCVAGEATSNIEGSHVEAKLTSLLEDGVGVTNGLVKGQRVRGSGADVEADTNNVETEVLGKGQQALSGLHGGTKLHAETAHALAIVGHDAEEELGSRVELGDLVELIGVVKSHLLDASSLDVTDVRVGLARLGVDDAVRAKSQGKDLLDLGLGGAIEAGTKLGEELDDLGVGVALDGCTSQQCLYT